MGNKSESAGKGRPGCLSSVILWPFRGRWWVKTLKLTLVAVILYNVLAFFLMWCPPVRGVVVDVDTGKPIQGAIVQKFGEGPFIFPSEKIEGLHVAGADAQATTGANGRFSFPPAAVRPTPSKAGWLGTLYPFQWFNTVKVRVWQKDYIGVDSYEKGLWWNKSTPRKSGGYCKVVRYRIPFIGFFYRISLKKAVTEKEWVVKIGSVNLSGLPLPQSKDVEQQRLFDDLTGYLQRWPKTSFQDARLPNFLGGYRELGPSAMEYSFNCARFHAAAPQEQRDFLQKFTFLGHWLEQKLTNLGVSPQEALSLPEEAITGTGKEQPRAWLVHYYKQWFGYRREVDECMRGNK